METARKAFFKKYTRLLVLSACLVVIAAALSIAYGFIAHGFFTLRYVFSSNFITGAILIMAGILIMFIPSVYSSNKGSKLLDSSTFVEKSHDDRERRQKKGRTILWTGIFVFVLAGLIQLLLSVII